MFERFLNNRLILAVSLFLTIAILAGCASQPSAQPAAQLNNSTAAPAGSTTAPVSGTPAASGNVSFVKDIQPILQNSCISCHGGTRTSKGLDMKTYASLMTGSQNGAVVIAGNAGNSLLIQSIQSGQMPRRGTPLPDAQINLLVEWVNAGAKNN